MNDAEKFGQLRRGLLEFVVLKVISAKKAYAADILAALADTDFVTGEGTLYPLVSRLRRDGLIDYEWVESEAGPPRKYFHLTLSGQTKLAELETYWQSMHQTIASLGGAS